MNSLLVGGGISDRATPGDGPVADAVTAEALGYDFVSVFDHPVAEAGMPKLSATTLCLPPATRSGPTRRMRRRPC